MVAHDSCESNPRTQTFSEYNLKQLIHDCDDCDLDS